MPLQLYTGLVVETAYRFCGAGFALVQVVVAGFTCLCSRVHGVHTPSPLL